MSSASVGVRAFGEPVVRLADGDRPVTRGRERNVLAVLVAARGAPVAADRLVADVWGEDGPARALTSLQVAVSRLRAVIEPGRGARETARVLVSTAAGYALRLPERAVDVWRFEDDARRALAPGSPADRLAAAQAARHVWGGRPYAGCDPEVVRQEADRLDELHRSVQEAAADALLELDRAGEALQLLAPLSREHPYRENLWALLALALYRLGRQAEALAALKALRGRLAEDLGVDPTPRVQDLERALLTHDPGIAGRPAPPATIAPASPPAAAEPPRSVGRAAALAEVRAVVDDLTAGAGGPAALVVSGEPGIGKSRLVEDLAALATAAGAAVLTGRCLEGDLAPAFWPWLPVVRALVEQDEEGPDAALAPLLEGPDDGAGGPAGDGATLRLFDAVTALLTRAAARRPLVVVLEDLHWADVSSLRLLAHVVGSATPAGSGARLLLAGTRRTVDAPTSEPLVDALAALARAGAHRVRLEGLDAAAVAHLLTSVLGEHDPDLDVVVERATAGNPFYVLEYGQLVRTLPAGTDPAALPVPDGVRDVLRRRLFRLPAQARTVLVAASVAGRSVDVAVVAEVAGLPEDDVLDLLDLALASGLLRDDGGYAFAHALTRETLYADVPAARRMRLHDKVSRALETRWSGTADRADRAAEVAHHAHLAAPLGAAATARATGRLAAAARVAEARHAHDEALDLWQRAEQGATGEDRIAALSGMARARLRQGRTAQARHLVDEGVRAARDLGRWDLVADTAALLNGAGVWSWREHGQKDDEFIGLLEETLARGGEQVDDRRRARLLATLQMESYYGWESGVADAYGAQSLELARRAVAATGDEALLLEVLLRRAVSSWGPGLAPRRFGFLAELLEHRPGGELEVAALFQIGSTLYECRRVAEADAAIERCSSMAGRLRHSGVEIPLAWWQYTRARDVDDPEADDLGAAALELHRSRGFIGRDDTWVMHEIRSRPVGAPVPADVLAAVGDLGPHQRALVGYAVLESGDPEGAAALLGEPAPVQAADYAALAGDALRLGVLAAAGSRTQVEAALTRVEPYAGDVLLYGTIDHLGAVDLFLAQGYAALGDLEGARSAAAAAVALCRELDCRPWLRRAEALVAELALK